MEDKLDLKSPDLVNENFKKLAALFPNCVTESADGKAIDFDLLKQELNHAVVEGNKERYRLEWPGKREAIVTANLPTTKTLRPVREDSVDFDNTENLYIEGDNLEVLKLLQESYLSKIKMIYIDPPYNTGKDKVYKDNFRGDKESELVESGQKDEYNQRLVANPETAGRYHSDWLSMMYPRLKLARNLLTHDGVIFISIDDNEVHNLRKVCDEIFGEVNFLGTICWKHTQQSKNDERFFSRQSNYNVVYSKNEAHTKNFRLNRTEVDNKNYSNPDNDPKGDWRSGDVRSPNLRETLKYNIEAPDGTMILPPDKGWRWSKETAQQKINSGEIVFKEDNSGIIRKIYLANQEGRTPENLWQGNDYGTTRIANSELKEIFGDDVPFDTPKPTGLIKKMIELFQNDNEFYVLDFFSGSATSAQSVLDINTVDKGKRKFIQVQLPEPINEKSKAYKDGYANICEIGKERIRRAGQSIVNGQWSMVNEKKAQLEKLLNGQLIMVNGQWRFPEGVIIDEQAENLLQEINHLQLSIDNLDTGFRVYRLDSSNIQDVYYKPQDYIQGNLDLFADNVKPDRTADDLLAQVMLDWGLPLSLKIEQDTISGKKVFKVAENSLYACFDSGIDDDFAKVIAADAPLRIVFKDSGFKNDTAKINVKQLLKQLSPETEMKVI